MDGDLVIETHHADDVVTVRVAGELDLSNAHLVQELVDLAAPSSAASVELDASGITFCDLAGIDALTTTAERLRGVGATCSLRTSTAIRRLEVLLRDLVPRDGRMRRSPSSTT